MSGRVADPCGWRPTLNAGGVWVVEAWLRITRLSTKRSRGVHFSAIEDESPRRRRPTCETITRPITDVLLGPSRFSKSNPFHATVGRESPPKYGCAQVFYG